MNPYLHEPKLCFFSCSLQQLWVYTAVHLLGKKLHSYYLVTHRLTSLNCLNGTNWTMSLVTGCPVVDFSSPLSPSRSSMALKSAGPTPTMMIERGSSDARTMASRVWSKSVISPSVRMRRTKYCCRETKTNVKVWVFLVNSVLCCVCVLTEALLVCAAALAMEATWLMMGEKFVGPERWSLGKTVL